MHVRFGVAKNIQIRNVPDDVHEVYKRRAAAAGKSLQEYLLSDLTDRADRLTMKEVLDRFESRRGRTTVTMEEIVEDIHRHRDA